MTALNEELRRELVAMEAEDLSVREALASCGSLFDGYHPEMEAVHRKNAARLAEVMDRHGWPGRALAGDDGAGAAWRIAQHAISEPAFQRRALALLGEAASRGDAPRWQAAMLEDRIRALEGHLQTYGTQFDWDDEGEMSPHPPIEDPDRVDERRRGVGLRPLAEDIRLRRSEAARSGERPPRDPAERRRRAEEWARRAGWRRGGAGDDETGR